jgi:protein-tyrosine-phosphatase|tara:strand:- start:201 stop:647 length:447 start_codon:yes stop_codon:yes gene_type:complete
MRNIPSAILIACNMNSIRSPMAEGLLKFLQGDRIFIDSVGVRPREVDGFSVAVMDEIGIDISSHNPKSFDDLEDSYFDLVITLSPEAQHKAIEMTRVMACDVEFWNTFDPSLVESENRETILEAYRQVRDQLLMRLKTRFPQAKIIDT